MKTTGNGYLFKRNGIYHLQYDVGKKRKKQSLHTKSKIKAEKLRDEILKPALTATTKEQVLLHVAEARNIVKLKHHKIEQVWDLYSRNSSRPDSSPGTLNNYNRNWLKFQKWLSEHYPRVTELSGITTDIAGEYAQKLWEDGISSNTFNYHLQSLKLIIKTLTQNSQTPFAEVKRKKDAQEHRRSFSKEEVLKILSAFDNDKLAARNTKELKLLCYLGAYTPLRLIDCCFLKWEHIHLSSNENYISLTPMKTRKFDKKVNIPIHESLKKEIEKHKDNESQYVLPITAVLYNKNPDAIVDDFKKVLTFCDFKDLNKDVEGKQRLKKAVIYGFHSFKHSYATFAVDAGIPINTLSSITGTNARTLEQYYIASDNKNNKEVLKALPCKKSSAKNFQTSGEKLLSISKIIKNSKDMPEDLQKKLLALIKE